MAFAYPELTLNQGIKLTNRQIRRLSSEPIDETLCMDLSRLFDDEFANQARKLHAQEYYPYPKRKEEWDFVAASVVFPAIKYENEDNIIRNLNYGWASFQHDPAAYAQHPRGKSFRAQTWNVYLCRFREWMIEWNPDKIDIILTWEEKKHEKLTAILNDNQYPLETTAYDLYRFISASPKYFRHD